MTWIIEIMSNVKGHKNKPSIFKSKKATRQPSNLRPPPPIETLAMVIDISNSLQCNNDLQSQSHFFFWRTVYFEFYSNNMEGSVLEKKKFSCITLYFAKMDRTYFFFLLSLPNYIYHSLCKMPPLSFLWHSQSFYSFHPTGTREEVKCHA